MSELEQIVFDGEVVDETCGCGAPGDLVIDPYALELDRVEEHIVLCDECYDQRCLDI